MSKMTMWISNSSLLLMSASDACAYVSPNSNQDTILIDMILLSVSVMTVLYVYCRNFFLDMGGLLLVIPFLIFMIGAVEYGIWVLLHNPAAGIIETIYTLFAVYLFKMAR